MRTKHIGPAAALAIVMSIAGAAGVMAQSPQLVVPDLHARNIRWNAAEPRGTQITQGIYNKLQQRKLLEELGQFLAPLNWPRTLRLIAKRCRPPGQRRILQLRRVFASSFTTIFSRRWGRLPAGSRRMPSFATPQEVIVGGLVGLVLHEAGLAAFDMLGTPLLGSDEDAGDMIASLMGLQFGQQVALAVIKGTYLFWIWQNDQIASQNLPFNFAGRSSVAPQRAVNTTLHRLRQPAIGSLQGLGRQGTADAEARSRLH